jgi:hypothetical protein
VKLREPSDFGRFIVDLHQFIRFTTSWVQKIEVLTPGNPANSREGSTKELGEELI